MTGTTTSATTIPTVLPESDKLGRGEIIGITFGVLGFLATVAGSFYTYLGWRNNTGVGAQLRRVLV